jgi:hypothetical protein
VVFADAEHVQAQGVGQFGVADGVGQPLPRLDLAAGGGVALQSLSEMMPSSMLGARLRSGR